MKLPPLNLRESIDFFSYASRRTFPGLITTLGGGKENEESEKALGNWKTEQQMEMHYSALDERLSFAAKHIIIEACKQTARARAAADPTGHGISHGAKSQRAAPVSTP